MAGRLEDFEDKDGKPMKDNWYVAMERDPDVGGINSYLYYVSQGSKGPVAETEKEVRPLTDELATTLFIFGTGSFHALGATSIAEYAEKLEQAEITRKEALGQQSGTRDTYRAKFIRRKLKELGK